MKLFANKTTHSYFFSSGVKREGRKCSLKLALMIEIFLREGAPMLPTYYRCVKNL